MRLCKPLIMKEIPIDERIIFALDVPTVDEAISWARRLSSHVRFYKVGLELFLGGGWGVVDELIHMGHKVMLDLKFFDIPETVKRAIRQVRQSGVTFCTIHGNEPIIRAATEEKGGLEVLAVTVLTSFDPEDLYAMGLKGTVEELVLTRAQKAVQLGCDGVVASPKEVSSLRNRLGHDFLIVTPGIRPHTGGLDTGDDQRRTATPYEAIKNGADHLVIGRPIRDAKDPIDTVHKIQEEIKEALTATPTA